MTPNQCKTARMLLEWSQEELARQANVNIQGVRTYEDANEPTYGRGPRCIRAAFIRAGIEFNDDGSVTSDVIKGRNIELKGS